LEYFVYKRFIARGDWRVSELLTDALVKLSNCSRGLARMNKMVEKAVLDGLLLPLRRRRK
jgi:hypothetical protein